MNGFEASNVALAFRVITPGNYGAVGFEREGVGFSGGNLDSFEALGNVALVIGIVTPGKYGTTLSNGKGVDESGGNLDGFEAPRNVALVKGIVTPGNDSASRRFRGPYSYREKGHQEHQEHQEEAVAAFHSTNPPVNWLYLLFS
ncbi:MAG: hypothetical protein PHZ19_10090, partial [Candidatus Thermoplasmatota archaeon]|nr:hypothetical protein [Candidatus Thermoplasmatota archaeon]